MIPFFFFILDVGGKFFHSGDLQEWLLWIESSSCHMLDSAGSSWLHNKPTRGHSPVCQPSCWCLWAKYLRRGKCYTDSDEWRKKSKRALGTPKVREYRGVRGVTSAASEIPLNPLEWTMPEQMITFQSTSLGTPHQSNWIFSEGIVICWEPTMEKIFLTGK